jgi:hypothetical protein
LKKPETVQNFGDVGGVANRCADLSSGMLNVFTDTKYAPPIKHCFEFRIFALGKVASMLAAMLIHDRIAFFHPQISDHCFTNVRIGVRQNGALNCRG